MIIQINKPEIGEYIAVSMLSGKVKDQLHWPFQVVHKVYNQEYWFPMDEATDWAAQHKTLPHPSTRLRSLTCWWAGSRWRKRWLLLCFPGAAPDQFIQQLLTFFLFFYKLLRWVCARHTCWAGCKHSTSLWLNARSQLVSHSRSQL